MQVPQLHKALSATLESIHTWYILYLLSYRLCIQRSYASTEATEDNKHHIILQHD